MTEHSDSLAAELTAIGDRAARSGNLEVWTRVAAAESDRDRLLGAVKAALLVTDPLTNETKGGMFMAALNVQVRETVLRELLSKEETDG